MNKGKQRTAEQWCDLIREQKQSGMSMDRWCKENDIPTSSFYHAHHRYGKQAKAKTKGSFQKFVPSGTVEMNGSICIELKNGTKIILSSDNKEGLQTVLTVLGSGAEA